MKTIIILVLILMAILDSTVFGGHDEKPDDYYYYYMGNRHVNSKYMKKQTLKDFSYYVKRVPRTTTRYENGKRVRYYFGNFRNGYDGSRSTRRRCR